MSIAQFQRVATHPNPLALYCNQVAATPLQCQVPPLQSSASSCNSSAPLPHTRTLFIKHEGTLLKRPGLPNNASTPSGAIARCNKSHLLHQFLLPKFKNQALCPNTSLFPLSSRNLSRLSNLPTSFPMFLRALLLRWAQTSQCQTTKFPHLQFNHLLLRDLLELILYFVANSSLLMLFFEATLWLFLIST